jgi:hypothetical protein
MLVLKSLTNKQSQPNSNVQQVKNPLMLFEQHVVNVAWVSKQRNTGFHVWVGDA